MILLLLIIIIAGILWSLIDNLDGEKGMKEFCELECKQDIKRKYNFCC